MGDRSSRRRGSGNGAEHLLHALEVLLDLAVQAGLELKKLAANSFQLRHVRWLGKGFGLERKRGHGGLTFCKLSRKYKIYQKFRP